MGLAKKEKLETNSNWRGREDKRQGKDQRKQKEFSKKPFQIGSSPSLCNPRNKGQEKR